MHVRGAKHQFYFLDEIPDYKPNKVYNPLLRKLYNRSLNSTQSASRSLNSSKEQVAAQINRFEVQSSSNNPANNLSSSLNDAANKLKEDNQLQANASSNANNQSHLSSQQQQQLVVPQSGQHNNQKPLIQHQYNSRRVIH